MEAFFGYTLSLVVLYSMLLNHCYCLNLKLFNSSKLQNEDQWKNAVATWYGPPNGAGSTGAACGYTDTVEKFPLSKMVAAGGPSLFKGGQGCGGCYEVKCTEKDQCSGNPVTVMITDDCGGCTSHSFHFDLSGTAMGSMAKLGQQESLRNIGKLNIQFRRVSCRFGKSIAFTIDNGANPYYFSTEIEYVNGDGDLISVNLKQDDGSNKWVPMYRLWGERWALNSGSELRPPFSIQLTEACKARKKTIVAKNVIPRGWKPGDVHRSMINF